MYKYKEFYITSDLVDFLNQNKIPKENIIKVGMTYNTWTLVYYSEETGMKSTDDASAFVAKPLFSDMRAEVERMFDTEREE